MSKEVLRDLVIEVCGSFLTLLIIYLYTKLNTRLRNTSVVELGRRLFGSITVQSLTRRFLTSSIAVTIAFFILVNVPLQTVIAPPLFSEIAIERDSSPRTIKYSIWKSGRTGKSYIIITDGYTDDIRWLKAVDNSS